MFGMFDVDKGWHQKMGGTRNLDNCPAEWNP